MEKLKVISFNVNSIRVRLGILLDLIEDQDPDIIGLQETKVQNEDFPEEALGDIGYEVYYFGQKTHYGVALLSKKPLKNICKGFESDTESSQKRFISADYELDNGDLIHVINGYFPQGEKRNHPTKFPDKLKFYEDLFLYLKGKKNVLKTIVMGDLNIAPDDKDVGIGELNKLRWLSQGACSFLPEERKLIERLKSMGYHDTFRELKPDEDNLFSWFDFRTKAFEAEPKRGLRIDQIWVSKILMNDCVDVGIDYEMRRREKPSDHCPIWAAFEIN